MKYIVEVGNHDMMTNSIEVIDVIIKGSPDVNVVVNQLQDPIRYNTDGHDVISAVLYKDKDSTYLTVYSPLQDNDLVEYFNKLIGSNKDGV